MGAANAQTLKNISAPMAPDCEEIWAPLLHPYSLRLLEMLPLNGARRVLQLGCGVGRLFPDTAGRAPDAAVIPRSGGGAMLGGTRCPREAQSGTQPR